MELTSLYNYFVHVHTERRMATDSYINDNKQAYRLATFCPRHICSPRARRPVDYQIRLSSSILGGQIWLQVSRASNSTKLQPCSHTLLSHHLHSPCRRSVLTETPLNRLASKPFAEAEVRIAATHANMSGRALCPPPPCQHTSAFSLSLSLPSLAFELALTGSQHLVRFLDLIKPFTPFLPEVSAPETAKVPFNQKLMWTGVSLNSCRAKLAGICIRSCIACF